MTRINRTDKECYIIEAAFYYDDWQNALRSDDHDEYIRAAHYEKLYREYCEMAGIEANGTIAM